MKTTDRELEKQAGILEWLARRDPRNYVPVFAGMSPHGVYGSGELNMATNVAGGLRDAGLNAVLYDPTPEKMRALYSYYRRRAGLPPEEAMRRIMHGVSPERMAEEATLYRLGRYMYTMSPIEALKGKSLQELMAAAESGEFSPVLRELQGLTPRETASNFKKFKKLLDRGAFDGITPGGLRDHLMKGRDAILNGRVVLGDPRQLFAPANAGKGGSFFNGALGMGYSDMPHGRTPVVGSGNDLGRLSGFNANYTPGDTRPMAQSVIPFTDVGRTATDRIPLVPWFRRRRARRDLARMMAEGLGVPEEALKGKKLALLSGGAAGENIPLKMQQVHDALSGRGDTVFMVNAGNNPAVYEQASALAKQLNGVEGGPRYVVRNGFAPADSRRFAKAVDLNLSYGGSSTLSETLANSNPYMFMRDTPLNERNIGWATGQFGPKVRTFDSSGMAARDFVDDLLGPDKASREGFFWQRDVGTRYVHGPKYDTPVPGLRKEQALGTYRGRTIALDPAAERARLAEALNDMLDNPDKYRRDARAVSGRFLGALDASGKNVVNNAVAANGGLFIGGRRLPRLVLRLMGISPGEYMEGPLRYAPPSPAPTPSPARGPTPPSGMPPGHGAGYGLITPNLGMPQSTSAASIRKLYGRTPPQMSAVPKLPVMARFLQSLKKLRLH